MNYIHTLKLRKKHGEDSTYLITLNSFDSDFKKGTTIAQCKIDSDGGVHLLPCNLSNLSTTRHHYILIDAIDSMIHISHINGLFESLIE